jgi:SAM-dependent methyltransferase
MSENNEFWNFYWETRLRPMENLGKRESILAASRLIRRMAQGADHPLRLLELGCGEGQVIGTLLDAHGSLCDVGASVGVDYKPQSLANCARDYPGFRCIEGDFTDADLLPGLGKFDIVLLVNALHEVFSDTYSPALGEIDVPLGKQRVEHALGSAARCLAPGGWLVLFDGMEMSGDPQEMLRICFKDAKVRRDFERFAREYHPFKVKYHQKDDPLCVSLSRRHFTRYITKSIFLRKGLWKSERFESYQYFTEEEQRAAFDRQGLEIRELRKLTVNEVKWNLMVDIEASEAVFPDEHIMILAQQAATGSW